MEYSELMDTLHQIERELSFAIQPSTTDTKLVVSRTRDKLRTLLRGLGYKGNF